MMCLSSNGSESRSNVVGEAVCGVPCGVMDAGDSGYCRR